jgi:4a-hydroxytetrahydrobiopterin dehydratase
MPQRPSAWYNKSTPQRRGGTMDYTDISNESFDEIEGLGAWRVVLDGIRADYRTGSFPAAARFVTNIADAAEAMQHHPDIDVRYPDHVVVSITTHATGGLTELDVALARAITELASLAGVGAASGMTQAIEIAIDTMDADRIRPFWAAVLGYREQDGALTDPLRIGPSVWFQQMDEPRTERNRFHLDVVVPHDVADQRVSEAIAAGGTLVSAESARAFWVLADADGNEACVCTWQDRSDDT